MQVEERKTKRAREAKRGTEALGEERWGGKGDISTSLSSDVYVQVI